MDRRSNPSIWSWLLTLGLAFLSIAAGIVVLVKPGHSLATLAVVTGIFILVDGLAGIIGAVLVGRDEHASVAVLAVLDVVVGALLIRHPVRGVVLIALALGIWLIANGVMRMYAATILGGSGLWAIVTGAALVIAGVIIVASPHIGFSTLALVAGLGFIAYGIGLLVTELDRHYFHAAGQAGSS